VVEAMNGRRELFGFDRLNDAVRGASVMDPRRIVEEIMGEIRAFIGTEPLADDLTLIAVRVD
jgi:sigma-B regulation protein RsbU (phosphoserine phosphatase)